MIDTFIGKTLAGKYRIDSLMRETELGNIYHATHLTIDKAVAVKILSPALAVDENIVRRFSSEAKTISHLSHPNILNVTDFGSDTNGTVYIVFEDAGGETLKTSIGRDGMFAPDRAVSIAKQIASALSAAHAKGIIHGNLNSENVVLADENAVKVLDLGAVRLDAVAASDDELSFPKVEYLSPEQCADAGDVDERSDIYALGVILYEMLASETPFKGENASELMLKHAQDAPPPLSAFRQDLPADLEPVVLKALSKNPEMRQQTATEFIEELNSVSLNAPRAATASNNNIWKTAFVVLVGISLLSITLIWATSSKQTNPTTLQADANSQPVQPLNPATGMNEQGLATIVPISQEMLTNSNMQITAPDSLGGSDTNPYWSSGTQPPGAPVYVPPTGQYYDGNTSTTSPFTRDDTAPAGGNIVCDEAGKCFYIVQPNPNANANVKPSPSPKTTKSPAANTAVQPTPATTDTPKPQTTPTPEPKPPVKTPTPAPKAKTSPSGKTQDSD